MNQSMYTFFWDTLYSHWLPKQILYVWLKSDKKIVERLLYGRTDGLTFVEL